MPDMQTRKMALVIAGIFGSVATAEAVTTAVRAEANALARQYTGQSCRTDYDLDTERYRNTLSAAQVKSKRTAIYNDWKADLDEDARDDGDTYRIGYDNNRVWYWQKDSKGKAEFKVVTISTTGERELSCDL